MTKRVWMLRHGERVDVTDFDTWEKHKRFPLNRYDSPITVRGELQGKLSGEEILKNQNVENIKYCYCSPFTRTIDTALETIEEIEKHTGHKILIRIEYALCEIPSVNLGWPVFGHNVLNIKDGKIVLATDIYLDEDMTLENIYKRWNRRATYFDTEYEPMSTFEENKYISSDIIKNFNKPIEIYNAIIEKEKENTYDILLVTHGMTITSILSSIYGNIISKTSNDYKFSGGNTCCLVGIEINNNKSTVFYTPSIDHWKKTLK